MPERISITAQFLEDHDPKFTQRGNERRFLCPFCGEGKRKDNGHRSLCLNVQSDLWKCWRCNATGKLSESYASTLTVEKRAALRRRQVKDRLESQAKFKEELRKIVRLENTPGARYLLKERGIPTQLASESGVRYSEDFYGGKAVLFPIRNSANKLIAVNARYCEGWRYVKHRTAGNKMSGIFKTVGALEQKSIFICEAPIDALSLAVGGYPAVATCGSGLPDFLLASCVGKSAILATDNETEGDKLAVSWARMLMAAQVTVFRLRPPLKDWNKTLTDVSDFGEALANSLYEVRRFSHFDIAERKC